MIGYAAIIAALVATGLAVVAFAAGERAPGGRKKAFVLYILSAILIGVAALYLYWIIITDKFNYAYVFGYSAKDLPLVYKISAFWAGQEGSFLLWALFHAGFGLLFARAAAVHPGVMAVYSFFQMLLLVVLTLKSPFMALAEPRSDGAGLNPLLQDPWMVIHPPVVFLGYAGLAIPFSYAAASLIFRRHGEWTGRSLPWTLISWTALGAGIFVGGFWAYKVLGWGGYWGWDPVENASLVPWLITGALVHAMLLMKVRPAAVKLAYLAAIAAYAMALYGTFLTRSGILRDFSAHAFANEGVGGVLGLLCLIAFAPPLALLILRWPELPAGKLYDSVLSRDFMLLAAAAILSVMAAIVTAGMSAPLLTGLVGAPQSVDASFYNRALLPWTVALMLLLAVSPAAGVKKTAGGLLSFWPGAVGALISIAAAVFEFKIANPWGLLIVGLAMAILINYMVAFGRNRGVTLSAGLTHTGVAVMMIGVIMSSAGSVTTELILQKGQSQELFGGKIIYQGVRSSQKIDGFVQDFTLQGIRDAAIEAVTKFDKRGLPAAREPGIYRGLAADIYLVPLAREKTDEGAQFLFSRGETKECQDGLALEFIGFGWSRDTGGTLRVAAFLRAFKSEKQQDLVIEGVLAGNGRLHSSPAGVFGRYQIDISAINMIDGKVGLYIKDLTETAWEQVVVEATRKPLVNLVWLGTILLTAGAIAGVKRRRLHAPAEDRPGPEQTRALT